MPDLLNKHSIKIPHAVVIVPVYTIPGSTHHMFVSTCSLLDDDADSLRRQEALLAKKKQVLEKVLDRLQELILLSTQEPQQKDQANQSGEYSDVGGGSSFSGNSVDDLRAEDSERRIFSPYSSSIPVYDDSGEEEEQGGSNKWWQRIFSNRH